MHARGEGLCESRMREIRTSGSMSGDGKRDDVRVATAPNPDSTENKGAAFGSPPPSGNVAENKVGYVLMGGMLLKRKVVSFG